MVLEGVSEHGASDMIGFGCLRARQFLGHLRHGDELLEHCTSAMSLGKEHRLGDSLVMYRFSAGTGYRDLVDWTTPCMQQTGLGPEICHRGTIIDIFEIDHIFYVSVTHLASDSDHTARIFDNAT